MGRNKLRVEDSKCFYCGAIKLLEEFHKDKTRPNGVSSCCKNCSSERMAEYRRMKKLENKKDPV